MKVTGEKTTPPTGRDSGMTMKARVIETWKTEVSWIEHLHSKLVTNCRHQFFNWYTVLSALIDLQIF